MTARLQVLYQNSVESVDDLRVFYPPSFRPRYRGSSLKNSSANELPNPIHIYNQNSIRSSEVAFLNS